MKRVFKVGSTIALMASVILSSGCGCTLKSKKVIERTTALKETQLDRIDDELVDYVVTYKKVSNNGIIESVSEYIVKRDVDGDVYYLTNRQGSAPVGETINYTTIEEKIFVEDEVVKYSIGEVTVNLPSNYKTPAAAFIYLSTIASTTDYYNRTTVKYDIYKEVPYNACTPAEIAQEEDLPGILESFIDDTLSCQAKRKLFSKNTTYTVKYRVNTTQLTEMVISTDKNNRITSVNETNNIVVSGPAAQTVEKITFTVEYKDI